MFDRLRNSSDVVLLCVSIVAIAVLYFIYRPALSGPFLLDDVVNIPQTKVATLSLESVGKVVIGNHSGIFGRPIPAVSFLLNYHFWGDATYSFKVTNFIIHLLNGVLIYCLSLLLLCSYSGRKTDPGNQTRSKIMAFLIAAIWLLHPLQLSTVMYVVQRMSMLMTFFTLAALVLYLSARRHQIETDKHHFWYFPGVLLLTLLASLCKENGVLIIPLILLVELVVIRFKLQSPTQKKIFFPMFSLCILLPIVIGIVYFSLNTENLLESYSNRDFTLIERLLTQPGVIMIYLRMILLPDISMMSLYHDSYPIVSDLGLGSIISILTIAAMSLFVIVMRQRATLPAFGMGVFLISHSLESTILPLELVFEHRNYFALYGIVLPVVWCGDWILNRVNISRYSPAIVCLVLSSLGFQTHGRALEWKDDLTLNAIAVEEKPDSLRARTALAVSYTKRGYLEKALDELNHTKSLNPLDGFVPLAILETSCILGEFSEKQFDEITLEFREKTINLGVVSILGSLMQNHNKEVCIRPNYVDLEKLYLIALNSKRKKLNRSAELILIGNYAGILLKTRGINTALEFLEANNVHQSNNQGLVLRMIWLYIQNNQLAVASSLIEKLQASTTGKIGLYDSQIHRLVGLIDSERRKTTEVLNEEL